MSLGRAWLHKLPYKLEQARIRGFEGLELFYEDLEYFAKDLYNDTGLSSLLRAAEEVRKLCDEKRLEIICLQPFMHFEGLKDRHLHERKLEQLKGWMKIVKVLRTDLIVLPSNFLKKSELIDDGLLTAVQDFQELADIGAQESPPVQFAYESLAWGTFVDTWESCWDVVQRVDRPNFGICPDTFNIAARAFADPASDTGRIENAETQMATSLKLLKETLDIDKVVFLQLADAERLNAPLQPGHSFHNAEWPPRMAWSRNCRLFYGEHERGAYLPAKDVVETLVHDLGFRGWISHEVFSRHMAATDPKTPEILGARAAASWVRLKADIDSPDS